MKDKEDSKTNPFIRAEYLMDKYTNERWILSLDINNGGTLTWQVGIRTRDFPPTHYKRANASEEFIMDEAFITWMDDYLKDKS